MRFVIQSNMIVTYPDEILRKKSAPLKAADVLRLEIKDLVVQMRKEMEKAEGVGLAAVQVGILKRIILVAFEEEVRVFFNPKIIWKSLKKISIEEGCLSVPGRFGYVKRSASVWVSALDENGQRVRFKAEGISSIITQHEIDHLNGVLFIDKLIKEDQK